MNKENFNLAKIKLAKDFGAEITYEVDEERGNVTYRRSISEKCTKEVHPDLRNKLQELREPMMQVLNITAPFAVLEELKLKDAQQVAMDKTRDEVMGRIKVTGIALSGRDGNVGVIITGKMKASGSNMEVAVNSPRIKLSDNVYGFEAELQNIVADVEDEVYQYLFENKTDNVELL